jgi:hypothetical protein
MFLGSKPKGAPGRKKRWTPETLTQLLSTYEYIRRRTGRKREYICQIMVAEDYAAAPWNAYGRLTPRAINNLLTRAMSAKANPLTSRFLSPPKGVDAIKAELKLRAKIDGCAHLISDREFTRKAREIRNDMTIRNQDLSDLIIGMMAWKPSRQETENNS